MKRIILLLLAIMPLSVLAEPANFHFKQNELLQYYQNGKYEKELEAAISDARTRLEKILQRHPDHQKLAIVLDIDETSLSNIKSIETMYSLLDDVGDEIPAEKLKTLHDVYHDAAILPTLHLYQYAVSQGVNVFFITGRLETPSVRAGTEANLKEVGYTQYAKLILKKPGEHAAEYKARMRRGIVQSGYDIVLNVGDQKSDLRGGYADNNIKLPDPFYYIP